MERIIKSIKALFLTALLVGALSTCWNPIDWVGEVSDEVMQAKDMYLEVVEVTPVKNTAAFNPESPILIEFDRGIDLSSVSAESVVISPAENWPAPTFDTGTNTLKIMPYSLEGGASYTITINPEVKGIDGSALRTPYVWNFTTDNLPTGGLTIRDRSTLSATPLTAYTNELFVDLAIEANGEVNQMRYSTTAFTKDDDVLFWGAVAASANDVELLSGADGERTVYIQFRKYNMIPPIDLRTEVKSDTIILDTTPPAPVLNNLPSYFNGEPGGWTSNVTVTEAGSGVASYAWSRYSGTDVTFSTTNALNTTVTCSIEGSTRIRLTVKDGAENTGLYTSPSIPIDLTDPPAPLVSAVANPTYDTSPDFTWVTGGGGGGYRYALGSDGWTYTSSTAGSSSIAISEYGTNTMYVQESDAAGNWSSSGSASTFVYPKWIVPAHTATGVGKSVTMKWAKEVVEYITYTVYWKAPGERFYEVLIADTSSMGKLVSLAAGRYYWYYYITDREREKFPIRVPASSAFYFNSD